MFRYVCLAIATAMAVGFAAPSFAPAPIVRDDSALAIHRNPAPPRSPQAFSVLLI